MKSILVTGGTGYIGSHTVVELIQAGYNPIIVDNLSNSTQDVITGIESICDQSVVWYKGDCRDQEFLNGVFKKHPEISGVIHFAAFKAVGESVAEPLKYYDNNIGSLIQLLETMDQFDVGNLVFSSSCTVYGQPDHLPVDETCSHQVASSPYGYTKQVCEQIILDSNRANNRLTSAILRYFNPIGAHTSGKIGEHPSGVPDNLVPYLTQVASGEREKLTVFGSDYNTPDGTCIRDYIHVVDLAQAHVAALEWSQNNLGKCDHFNIGTGNGNSVQEVINSFEEVNQIQLTIKYGPRRNGDVEQIFASGDKAAKILNWKAKKSLQEALKDAWNWQKKINAPS